MLGAIAGDIIGSMYEFNGIKIMDFDLYPAGAEFTDDSILSVALAESLLHLTNQSQLGGDYVRRLREYVRLYPDPMGGYGSGFYQWARDEHMEPYNSYGNGAAMRVSAVGWAFDDLETVMEMAEASAAVTHNHPEGIKGAQATAAAIFLARTGTSKAEIKARIQDRFGYDLNRTTDQIRPVYGFDESCQGTVPESIIAFLESSDWEDAVRRVISLGGDADTQGCITGGIAEAFYGGLPPEIERRTWAMLEQRDPHGKLAPIVRDFIAKYIRRD